MNYIKAEVLERPRSTSTSQNTAQMHDIIEDSLVKDSSLHAEQNLSLPHLCTVVPPWITVEYLHVDQLSSDIECSRKAGPVYLEYLYNYILCRTIITTL